MTHGTIRSGVNRRPSSRKTSHVLGLRRVARNHEVDPSNRISSAFARDAGSGTVAA
jgi:hypothetical protein